MDTLLHKYGVNADMVESIRRLLANTRGLVAGDSEFFPTTMGVKQGCPLSPLLFGLYFDRVAAYVEEHVHTEHLLQVTNLALATALYADDVALLAPHPTSL